MQAVNPFDPANLHVDGIVIGTFIIGLVLTALLVYWVMQRDPAQRD